MRLNTATSHISVSVHRHGTKHMDSNPCVDSVFHPRRFTEHGTPTRAVVPVPNFVDRCAIPWTRIRHRQPALQMRNRLKTPAMSIAGKIARGASDDPRSSIGTAEAARRRSCDASLERGHGRSGAGPHQARCLPARRHCRRYARDTGARLSQCWSGIMITVMADGPTYVDLIW